VRWLRFVLLQFALSCFSFHGLQTPVLHGT
jgi:hypothetical protein